MITIDKGRDCKPASCSTQDTQIVKGSTQQRHNSQGYICSLYRCCDEHATLNTRCTRILKQAVNSRVKTNEDKILVLEQENSRKDSEIAKLKTGISSLQKANKRTVSENDGIKQSLEHQDMYIKRKNIVFTGVIEPENYITENPTERVNTILKDTMKLNNRSKRGIQARSEKDVRSSQTPDC